MGRKIVIGGTTPVGGSPYVSLLQGGGYAFSLRQLFTSATKCIKVRRDSDNTTLDIGFLAGVIDVGQLTTFVGANNGFIDTWYDQSGNGADASMQAPFGIANQPQIVAAGVVILDNGKPAIQYSGSTFNITSQKRAVNYITGEWMVVIVASSPAPGGTRMIYCLDNNQVPVNRDAQALRVVTGFWQSIAFNAAISAFTVSNALVVNTQAILQARRTPTDINGYLNGGAATNALTTGNPRLTNITPFITIGGSYHLSGTAAFTGKIQEIIHYLHSDDAVRILARDSARAFYGTY